MKRLLFIFFLIFFAVGYSYSETCNINDVKVFSGKKDLYGLKNPTTDEVILEAKYNKVIKVGDNGWLIQGKNKKFGMANNCGEITIKPEYSNAERLFDRWVKLGNRKDFGLYDSNGKTIVPAEFTLIEPLFGERFLTCKNYKYGIYNNEGKVVLSNKYDYIYMPDLKTIRIKYNDVWYELKKNPDKKIIPLSDNIFDEKELKILKDNNIIVETGLGASYGIVTATDYTLKFFSSFSNAYEDTIDELTLSKGVEAVPVLMHFSWMPKFPFVFVKNYCINIRQPDNSPLSGIRSNIKGKMN